MRHAFLDIAITVGVAVFLLGPGASAQKPAAQKPATKPASSSAPRTTAPGCRTYPTSLRTQHTGSGFTGVTESTCQFDRPSLELRCSHEYSDSAGNKSSTTVTTKYASVNDVLEEGKVNPPLRRSLWSITRQTGNRASGGGRLENTYDEQGRLRSESSEQVKTTYTAWDAAGRPTEGEARSARSSVEYRMVYGPSSMTMTTTTPQGSVVCTKTFDATGTEISNECKGTASTGSKLVTTVTGTARVCKAE
jgi:YD repeat-containing protein